MSNKMVESEGGRSLGGKRTVTVNDEQTDGFLDGIWMSHTRLGTLLEYQVHILVILRLPTAYLFTPFWSWLSTESCEIHPEIT